MEAHAQIKGEKKESEGKKEQKKREKEGKKKKEKKKRDTNGRDGLNEWLGHRHCRLEMISWELVCSVSKQALQQ